jgi:hypothetical protein
MHVTASEAFYGALTPIEQALWRLLRGGNARRVSLLAGCLSIGLSRADRRQQQQNVGAHIARINSKLPEGYKIEPGTPRGTYQLKRVS